MRSNILAIFAANSLPVPPPLCLDQRFTIALNTRHCWKPMRTPRISVPAINGHLSRTMLKITHNSRPFMMGRRVRLLWRTVVNLLLPMKCTCTTETPLKAWRQMYTFRMGKTLCHGPSFPFTLFVVQIYIVDSKTHDISKVKILVSEANPSDKQKKKKKI